MLFQEADIETFANCTGGAFTRISGMSRVMTRAHISLARRPVVEPLTYINPEMGVAELPNVAIKGAHSIVFSLAQSRYLARRMSHRDYEPLWDAGQWTRQTAEGLHADLERPTLHIKEPAFLLGLCNSNFGHFVWEGLMRTYMLSRIPGNQTLKVIVPHDFPRRFDTWLEAFGITPDRLIRIPTDKTVNIDTLHVSSTPFGRASDKAILAHESSLHFARHVLMHSRPRSHERTRLYFGRSDSRDKRCINEPEIIALLEAHGFRAITGTNTTPEEQIDLVCRAEVLIGAIGAATAVGAFAPEDCMIVEMTPHQGIFGIYNSTISAAILGQPFARAGGTRVILPDNPRPEPLWWDYAMDPGIIRGILESFLNRPPFET
jgi:capsular polysaccharide biosynthesis protein